MEPSDYDIHFGLCELAIRGFTHPRGLLQNYLAHFSQHLPLNREEYLRKAVQSCDEFSSYQCIDNVSRSLLLGDRANWGRVFIVYVFLSRLSLQHSSLHVKVVADSLWKSGLRTYVSKVGWNSALVRKPNPGTERRCMLCIGALVLSAAALCLLCRG